MLQTAYIIENDVVVNVIAVDNNTDLAQFNAEIFPDLYPLDIGYKRINDVWFDKNGVQVLKFDPLQLKASVYRDARNELLAKSDWTQVADSPLSSELKKEWAEYRQALRDMPKHPDFPMVIDLPNEPGQIIT